jgi:DNA mismatch repair protein MutS
MAFYSILFDQPSADAQATSLDEPDFFSDLNLDQVVAAVLAGREEYGLRTFFYAPLHEPGAVRYRQEVMRDLTQVRAREAIKAFALGMQTARQYLAGAGQSRERFYKERLFLDAAAVYCDAVTSLTEELAHMTLASRGLMAFRDYLAEYIRGSRFTSLVADTQIQCEALATVEYNLHIDAGRVTVSRYGGESDYSIEVNEAFARFQRGVTRDYRVAFPDSSDNGLVEARIFELVARLYSDVFSGLDDYYDRHHRPALFDECLERFDQEVQSYAAFLDFMEPLERAGLSFCYPEVSADSKEEHASGVYDLALARKLVFEGAAVVVNSYHLEDPERVIVVTGPNQGGKTTFARMFGQLHYLAGLGLPVPGRGARLFLPDRMFTHFERQEQVEDLRGKLEDELLRARDMLQRATSRSVIIMNEGFTSTTLSDALLLGTGVLKRMLRMDLLCVYVTFVDELAALSEATVSMVAAVDEGDPTRRTYLVVREPASGLAYAAAIADKYGLGYERLRGRLAS